MLKYVIRNNIYIKSGRCFFSNFVSKKDDIFTISFIGRPNVGKSTLFNRLLNERKSLVDNTPGLTRDRKEAYLTLFGAKLRLVDTAGIEDLDDPQQKKPKNIGTNEFKNMIEQTKNQTKQALLYSDLAFFIVDCRQGITEIDINIANWLNKNKAHQEISTDLTDKEKLYEDYRKRKENLEIKVPKVLLLVNKAEDGFFGDVYDNVHRLKLGDPTFISAEHGDNLQELYSLIEKNIPEECRVAYQNKQELRIMRYKEYKEKIKEDFLSYVETLPENEKKEISVDKWEEDYDYHNSYNIEDNSDYDSDNEVDPMDVIITGIKEAKATVTMTNKYLKRPIKISIIGKQNAGKSSIINSLLKENRVIISDIPGTTRDSIPIEWIFKGRKVILTDTAGLQAKNKVKEKIDKMVSAATIKCIQDSHVIIYVIDSMAAFSPVDMKLINFIGDEGKSIVFVSNKWDLVENGHKTKAKKWIENQLKDGSDHYKHCNILFVSAKQGYKVDNIMENVINSYNAWNSRVSTAVLNEFNGEIKKVTNTPGKGGEHLNFKFLTQIKARPPTFVAFINKKSLFFRSHELFIKKMIAKEFNLIGVPIRLSLREKKGVFGLNKFKKLSVSTAKIVNKIQSKNEKLKSPTYKRRAKGREMLNK